MDSKPRRPAVIWATLIALGGLLVVGSPQLRAESTVSSPEKTARQSDVGWGRVSVELPTSVTLFPAGDGAVIANSQCLMCHSAGMVLRQPARTQDQWKATINKMRSAYGAPLPAEQVDALAAYLSRLIPSGNKPLTSSAGPHGVPQSGGNMNPIVILLSAFLLSLVALGVFIWSMRRGVLDHDAAGARVIFSANEVGRAEDPAAEPEALAALQNAVDLRAGRSEPLRDAELAQRAQADRSSATVAFVFLSCAIGWLVLGSFAGLIASIKLHEPDWLTSYEWLTFGRIRTIHLNAVVYGWTPMAGLGLAMWMLPRLLKTTLQGGRFALLGAVLWNAGLIAGVGATAVGLNTGLEWLEMPWQVDLLLVTGGALIGIPLLLTVARRTVDQLYVSIWYLGAALLWFPILFLVANLPGVHFGVEQATMNWWYGHNVLGYFFTPLALAAIYYFLPKVIGRPIQSYNLSLLGFWTHAFFYGQVGGHHLIGGPVPAWLVTLSIVQSVLMIVPVIAFATNQTLTMKGYWGTLVHSPTLRFVVMGAIMYVLVSLQGSLEALRGVNTITHFTHFTVGHAHVGMYAFVAITLFGGIYFVMPRVVEREWPYPRLIAAHFWLVVTGMTVYIVSLTIGGWLQGLAMLDAARPFMDSVAVTLPWLEARSVGGALMTAGHLIFAAHFLAMVLMLGPRRERAALFHLARTTEHA